jgi:sulfite reductase alpha subunit-like flavoprotein
MPLEILIDMLGRLSPREFSISSSNLKNKNSVEVTLGVVEYTTLLGREKIGICSDWIHNFYINNENKLLTKEEIPFSIKSGNFPKINLEDNLILIATGTGVAPFRSLLWERYQNILKNQENENQHISGKTLLFFGCRNKEIDFLFSEEFEIFKNSSEMNFELFTAFSRDQEHKIYVQHLVKQQSNLIYNLLFNNKSQGMEVEKEKEKNILKSINCNPSRTFLFLVGNSKVLPKSIDKALIHILNKENLIEESEALKIIYALKKSGRYYVETW